MFLHSLDLIYIISIAIFMLYAFYFSANTIIYFLSGFHKIRCVSKFNPYYPKVLIIVPVRDDPPVINTVNQLKKSNYPNFNIVIADDSTNEELKAKIDALGVDVVRRNDNIGWKGGALQNLVQQYKDIGYDYAVFFDADFQVPEDFIPKIVSYALQNEDGIIQGYQKHSMGVNKVWFGRLYQASAGGALVVLGSRSATNAAPIFTGSCTLIPFKVLVEVGMNDNSITEDWNFTLRALAYHGYRVKIFPDLVAEGAIPKSFRILARQQIRWATGTMSDYLRHSKQILLSKKVNLKEKISLTMQGLYPLNGAAFLISMPMILLFNAMHHEPIPLQLSFLFSAFFAISYGGVLLAGAMVDKLPLKYYPIIILLGFAFIAPFSIVQVVSIKRALLSQNSWVTTVRVY